MEEIKTELYDAVYKIYDEFITKRIDNKNALVTLCVAYVEFAKENRNLFNSLTIFSLIFITSNLFTLFFPFLKIIFIKT